MKNAIQSKSNVNGTNLNTVTMLNLDELSQSIVTEGQKYARLVLLRVGSHRAELSDIESFLINETYHQIIDKPQYHNIKGIRATINLYIKNYIKTHKKFNDEISFCAFDKKFETLEGNENSISFQEKHLVSELPSTEDQIELSDQMAAFRSTLNDRQNQILDLVSKGYGNDEICSLLNVSINTPKNNMNKIQELAYEFGLCL